MRMLLTDAVLVFVQPELVPVACHVCIMLAYTCLA